MTMRTITLAALLLASLACNRASAPPSGLESAPAPPEPSTTPNASTPDAVASATGRRYCDIYPQHCRPCTGAPGSCGGEPLAGACCCEGNGCVGVALAGECPVACDFLPCEWGYQDTGTDGKPVVICFD
jgi:hypothetical protein